MEAMLSLPLQLTSPPMSSLLSASLPNNLQDRVPSIMCTDDLSHDDAADMVLMRICRMLAIVKSGS